MKRILVLITKWLLLHLISPASSLSLETTPVTSTGYVIRERTARVRGGGGMFSPFPSPASSFSSPRPPSSSSSVCHCKKYPPKTSSRLHSVKKKDYRVIKGILARDEEFPWQAIILQWNFLGRNSWDFVCGGSLISSRHILTAAHCLQSNKKENYQVILGTHDRHNLTKSRTYRVSNFVKHRGYHEFFQHDNDIAILKIEDDLGREVLCDSRVQPVCLGGPMFPPKSHCVISGFGRTEMMELSDKLRFATIQLQSHETCQLLYSQRQQAQQQQNDEDLSNFLRRRNLELRKFYGESNNKKDNFVITERMLCAGNLYGGEDSCSGDSGGGLTCFDSQNYAYLTGIVSWGQVCGAKPSVYTSVSMFKDWINMEISLMG